MSGLQKLKAYFGMVPAEDMDGFDEPYAGSYRDDYAGEPDQYDAYADRPESRRRFAPRTDFRSEVPEQEFDADRPRNRRSWPESPPVRGSLAMEPQREAQPRLRTVAPPAAKDLSRITTLNPGSYSDALTIGEHYRDGTPVIINLTDMDDADAKRLVDFAAGLAFALRGSIDKITSKVFLLSPPNVDVTAEDKRKLAQGGFFSQN